MRIIAGEQRGREIKVPKMATLRPTSDRVREAIFSVLASLEKIEGTRVLDLYAGTGALAFEALSRGATAALAVERDAAHVKIINENSERLGLAQRLSVRRQDALDCLAARPGRFDLILADPPYAEHPGQKLLEAICAADVVAPGAVVVIEHGPKMELESPTGLELVKVKQYGDTAVSFFNHVQPL